VFIPSINAKCQKMASEPQWKTAADPDEGVSKGRRNSHPEQFMDFTVADSGGDAWSLP
jgi:hypothetical protein